MANNENSIVKEHKIFALTTDPIYIGTGGYTIGRVDNTIVRDPITKVPKIPGSSLAGVWRYYVTLNIFSKIKNIKPKREEVLKQTGNSIAEKIEGWINNNSNNWNTSNYYHFKGNVLLDLNCAGQDNVPQEELANITATNKEGKTGHCGHCLVCKGFGFSKKDISWQGMIFFSDLNILFFPVFTIYGTKWTTTVGKLKEAGIKPDDLNEPPNNEVLTKNGNEGHINLGWLYLKVGGTHSVRLNNEIKFENFELRDTDIIIVPESLFSRIVNSNLEVRTSVSIDPNTGAAKEGALFTSEAIPRGTILYGNVRIFDKTSFSGVDSKLDPLPNLNTLESALMESKHFFETLGIGGMTTRGFGRIKIIFGKVLEEKSIPTVESNFQDTQQTTAQGGKQ